MFERPLFTARRAAPVVILLFVFGSLVTVVGCTENKKEPQPNPTPSAGSTREGERPVEETAWGQKNVSTCSKLCKKTSSLECKNHALCEPTCRQAFGLQDCAEEVGAMLTCSSQSPLDAFECSLQGTPSLKSGHCEQEQQAMVRCITQKGPGRAAAP